MVGYWFLMRCFFFPFWGQSACFKEERSVLLQAQSEFLTALNYCFQDNMFLYLVMEFYPGGDLLTLITKFDEDMSEEMATFYIAEVVLAVEAIHRMGFVHRYHLELEQCVGLKLGFRQRCQARQCSHRQVGPRSPSRLWLLRICW